MNPLGEILAEEDIQLDLDVSNGTELLDHVAVWLAARHGMSRAAIADQLEARERLGSTALGHGVAIPHARMSACVRSAGVFVRNRRPIEFGAPDHRPVSLFLCLVVPNRISERPLQLLATAAAMFSDRDFRESLQSCPVAKDFYELVRTWSSTEIDQGRPS
jgi:nitrogen PTS system EIIA component